MNNNYWLERVANKLNASFLNGTVMSQWVPDEENPEAESRALDVLEVAGIIKSPGGYEGAPREYQYRIVDIKEGVARSAPTRQITDFDYGKFTQFCSEHDLNYKTNGIRARLSITDEKPSVYAGGKEYSFKTLQQGSTLDVIGVAIQHLDEPITFERLRQLLGKPNAFREQKNFKQIFRKNEFGEKGALYPFIEMSSSTFRLKNETLLTPNELATIKKASTN